MAAEYSHGERCYETLNTASATNSGGQVGVCTGMTLDWIAAIRQHPGTIETRKPSVVDALQAQSLFFDVMSAGANDQMELNRKFYVRYCLAREAVGIPGSTAAFEDVPLPESPRQLLSLFRSVYQAVDTSTQLPATYHLTLASAKPAAGQARAGHAIGLARTAGGVYVFDANFGCYKYAPAAGLTLAPRDRFALDFMYLISVPIMEYSVMAKGNLWLQRAVPLFV